MCLSSLPSLTACVCAVGESVCVSLGDAIAVMPVTSCVISLLDLTQSISCLLTVTAEGSISSSPSSQAAESGAIPGGPVASTHLTGGGKDYGGLDFKIIWDAKAGPAKTIHIVTPTMQEKAAWISDISQVCLILLFHCIVAFAMLQSCNGLLLDPLRIFALLLLLPC